MTGISRASHEDDPIQIVRTIGRIAQMLAELRDEYIDQGRDDTLDQIERRVQELQELTEQLRSNRETHSNNA